MSLITTFFASFVFIFLKAFQQRNVAFDHLSAIVPCSMLMAFAEFIVIGNVAVAAVLDVPFIYKAGVVLVIGLGSGLGALIATIIHKRVMK